MAITLSTLDTPALMTLLVRSAGEERDRQVDFLLYLAEFDYREAYRAEACSSLWVFCTRALRLREGSAGRRIGAMRVLRDFPELEAPLRDGRLSMTTAVTLRQVLTRQNLSELVARAAYLSDAETAHLVAALRPRPTPREGIRRISAPATSAASTAVMPEPASAPLVLTAPAAEFPAPAPRAEIAPFSADRFSLRVDMDMEFKADLETLRALRKHAHPTGNLSVLLHEAVKSPTTVANTRLRCIPHNGYAAEAVFGRLFMLKRRGRLPQKAGPEATDGSPAAQSGPG